MNPTNAHALIHNFSLTYRCCHAVTSILSVMSRRVIRVEGRKTVRARQSRSLAQLHEFNNRFCVGRLTMSTCHATLQECTG